MNRQTIKGMNRQTIMTRAWAIFRKTYGFPAVPFRSLGRECFGWALRTAWHEAREAARIAAIPAAVKAARAAVLQDELSFLTYREDYRAAQVRRREIEHELTSLAA
jgi:hypothetical protein